MPTGFFFSLLWFFVPRCLRGELPWPMAFQQRRHHERCLIPSVSATSAFTIAALLLLLIIASVSFFAPPLLNRHSLPGRSSSSHQHHRISSNLRKSPVDQRPNSADAEAFRVPIGGESSSTHDLWSSKLYMHYYGCSNTSNKFAAAETITRPNRYQMIATSGGLNQQRTGSESRDELLAALNVRTLTLAIKEQEVKMKKLEHSLDRFARRLLLAKTHSQRVH